MKYLGLLLLLMFIGSIFAIAAYRQSTLECQVIELNSDVVAKVCRTSSDANWKVH